jgi:hypothetical protein
MAFSLALLGASTYEVPVALGSYDLLATEILTGTQASITFSSLGDYAADYQHLQIRVSAKSLAAVGYNMLEMVMRINDSSTGYKSHSLLGDGSAVSSNSYAVSSQMLVGYSVSNDDGVGPTYAASIIDILDPFEAKNKTIRSLSGGGDSRATIGPKSAVGLYSGAWFDTTAVSSLTLYSATGGGASLHGFVTGSRLSLYGIRKAA